MKQNQRPLPFPLQVKIKLGDTIYMDKVFTTYPIVLGRGESCEVSLKDFDFVSRQHAVVSMDGERVFIYDLQSVNAFYVNGKKQRSCEIKNELDIRISTLDIHFEFQKTKSSTLSGVTATAGESEAPVFSGDKTFVDEMEDGLSQEQIEEAIPDEIQNLSNQAQQESQSGTGPKTIQANPLEKLPNENIRLDISQANAKIAPKVTKKLPDAPKLPKAELPKSEKIEKVSTPKMPSPKANPLPQPVNVDGMHLPEQERLTSMHPYASDLKVSNRVLEATVSWRDQIYDHQHFYPGTRITIGASESASLKLPTLRQDLGIAVFAGKTSTCLIPNGADAELNRDGKVYNLNELLGSSIVVRKGRGYTLKLQNTDVLEVRYSPTTSVRFRYAPAPKQLSRVPMINSDEEIKRSLMMSGAIHIFIVVLAILNPLPNAPKIKGVAPRYARILTQPPKPVPTPIRPSPTPKPTPAPTPERKKVEKKKPEKKIPPQKKPVPRPPDKVVQKKPLQPMKVHTDTKLKAVNKFPMEVEKPVSVQAVGALAALGSMKASPNQAPQLNVNINANAGGQKGNFSTSNVVAGISSKSGTLSTGGVAGVKTKGLGVGSGQGYGTQGLKGNAGQRGVGGAVLGSPKLFSISKEEGLSKKQIMDELNKHLGKIQRCYEVSLFSNPDLKGRVEYQWEIQASGNVEWVKVAKTDMSNADALNSCVKNVFMGIHFPKASNGQSSTPQISFPFGRL